MTPAGESAIVQNGVACVTGGAAITDPECVCGPPTHCGGCPCCDSGAPCAFPAPNTRMTAHCRWSQQIPNGPTTVQEWDFDEVVATGCTFTIFRGFNNAGPFGGGLLEVRWNQIDHWRVTLNSGAGASLGTAVIWRQRSDGAVRWSVAPATSEAPTGSNPSSDWSASVDANPCAGSITASGQMSIDVSFQGQVVRANRTFEATFTSEALSCPEAPGDALVGCEGCLDGFAPVGSPASLRSQSRSTLKPLKK